MPEANPVELLLLYAVDLLSETEAQHRAICRAQTQLDRLRPRGNRKAAPVHVAVERRKRTLAAVAAEVDELLLALKGQQSVMLEMRRTISHLTNQRA